MKPTQNQEDSAKIQAQTRQQHFVDRFENPLSSQFSGEQYDHATSRQKCRNFFRVATNCLVRKEVRTCWIEEIVLCTTLHTKQKTDLCAISRSIAMSMIFKEKKL